jgi:very-short-patch-repair endonuclease
MPDERHLIPAERVSDDARPEWSRIAQRQYGVITRRQLSAAGVGRSTIDRWARDGRLFRLYPEVFAAGHPVLVPNGRRLAAVLACGPAAWMAVTDGGAVHELCRSRGSRFTVVVPPGARAAGARRGIRVIRSTLGPDDVAVVRGIPVTSVARTIVDIAGAHPEEAPHVIDAAMALGTYDQNAMDRQLATGRRGVGVVRRVLATRHADSHHSKSRWESEMLRLLHAHDLPRPMVNQPIRTLEIEPDLLWLDERLVVEWDSWEHHHDRAAFEADREKTLTLQRAGFTVLRFTWRMTQREPERVVADVRAALTRRASSHTRGAGLR